MMNQISLSCLKGRPPRKETGGPGGEEPLTWFEQPVSLVKCLPGEWILEEGEECRHLRVILKGRVKVLFAHEDGRELVIEYIEKGGFFGEVPVIDGLPSPVSAVALEECLFMQVRREDFVRAVSDSPFLAMLVLKTAARKLDAREARVRGLAHHSAERRFVNFLSGLGTKVRLGLEECIVVERMPTHAEAAAFCGCTRETITRAVKRLITSGAMGLSGRRWIMRLSSLRAANGETTEPLSRTGS